MKTIISSIFILLLAPCNSQKNITTTAANDHSTLVISYQCTPCFGQCPTYTLTINGATKIATFKGDQNTEKIGKYTKAVSDNELTEWVNVFETMKFNSMQDAYLGNISDFPTIITTYTNKGKTKTIRDRSEAPTELKSLEATLREFADSEGWVKSDTVDH